VESVGCASYSHQVEVLQYASPLQSVVQNGVENLPAHLIQHVSLSDSDSESDSDSDSESAEQRALLPHYSPRVFDAVSTISQPPLTGYVHNALQREISCQV
jgi:hypothetical protein